jgi:hypothetical protein
MGQKMLDAKTIIDNIQNRRFKEALQPYGFDEARINEGQVLYDEVNVLIARKEQAYLDQIRATRELNDQTKVVSDYFTRQARIWCQTRKRYKLLYGAPPGPIGRPGGV